MRRLVPLLLFAISLQAATFYVSSAGNDANAGTSAGAAWLTLSHAVGAVGCGDTIVIVANGSYVAGDGTLPYMPGCSLITTIQSSALAQFAPPGYRTNPANDNALYGKLRLASSGLTTTVENHGSYIATYAMCGISSISGNTITLSGSICTSKMATLVNGSQIEFELNNLNIFVPFALPSPLTVLTHYFVVNCAPSGPACGNSGSTLQVAATAGGSPIALTACDVNCMAGTGVSMPLQFNAGSSTITSPDTFSTIANGTPVALSAVGMQLFGTVPAPFALDTIYYVVGLSARNFGLACSLSSVTPTCPTGSAAITATNTGIGPLNLANTNTAKLWALRGLEFVNTAGVGITSLLTMGTGSETSIIGMPSGFEVDRCYPHDNPGDTNGNAPTRGIQENGSYIYIHDSYFAGFRNGEAQAIAGGGSPGPTWIINNFLEAAGENILYGGNGSGSGVANANKIISGNYFFKPPTWKVSSDTGAVSGPCFYDATDPNHAGGEWYTDTMSGQKYQCDNTGNWATTATPVPTAPTIKNVAENKNLRSTLYFGNLIKYSWVSGQKGQVFTWHESEDSGPGRANDHMTLMNNTVLNVNRFLTGQSHCNGGTIYCSVLPPGNNSAINNLAVHTTLACGVTGHPATCGQQMIPDSWDGYPATNNYWNHNTMVLPDGVVGAPWSAKASFVSIDSNICFDTSFGTLAYHTYKNNILGYDDQGNCTNGGGTFAAAYTHANFHHNAMMASVSNYGSPGATNVFDLAHFAAPANNAAIKYASAGTGDYHLDPTSPFSAANGSATLLSDDGMDLGADLDVINCLATAAAAGTPACDSTLQIVPGSTRAIVRYNAPTTGVYTVTIYSSPVRNLSGGGNIVATKADSAADAISDVTRREVPLSGMTAGTQYWGKVAGGTTVMVFTFWTAPAGSGTYPLWQSFSSVVSVKSCTDKTMLANCVTANSTSPINVAAGSFRYWWQVAADPSTISLLVAP